MRNAGLVRLGVALLLAALCLQVLASITTDRPNTLRWIKGKKVPKQ